MEDFILKCAEFGILGIITLLLLTRGLNSLTKLTETTLKLAESQKALADSITKLTEKINSFSFQLAGIDKRLDKIEDILERNFKDVQNYIKSR